jgi:type I restriction enzyme S subunit
MELKPGYKQTEVGVIPEDWETGTLGQFWSIIDCKHVTASFTPSGYPIASIREVQSKHVNLINCKYTDKYFYSLLTEGGRQPRAGDLIMSRNATVGEVAQVTSLHPDFAMGQDVCLLQRRKKEFSATYLQALLQSPITLEQLASMMVGSTFKRANVEQIRSLKVAMPPPPEQKAIAERIDCIDDHITTTDALIVKKCGIKQAAMQELLTGKRRLPGFEGEWEETTVKDVVTRSFCGPSPTCQERNIEGNDEWGVLKTTAITWENGWSWKAHKLLPTSYWGKSEIELRQGDVLVTKAGPRHRVGVSAWIDQIPQRIIPSGKMIALRPNPKRAEPLMLAAAIASRSTQIHLDQRTTGMAESQVNFENAVLLSAPITLPSIAEQAAISEVCAEFDKELKDLEVKITTLRHIKEGMMQQLLTGKIRLQ